MKKQKYNPDFVEIIRKAVRSMCYRRTHKGKPFLTMREGTLDKIAIKAAIEIEIYQTPEIRQDEETTE